MTNEHQLYLQARYPPTAWLLATQVHQASNTPTPQQADWLSIDIKSGNHLLYTKPGFIAM